MPLGPDPAAAEDARARLAALARTATDVEDVLLSCLVVTGEPAAQRVLDDWLDQAVDTCRALAETADALRGSLPAAPASDDATAPGSDRERSR